MRLKVLKKGRYTIAAVMAGEGCPAEDFITSGEASYQASKKTQKADKSAVAQSIGWKNEYGTAFRNSTLTWQAEEKP